MVISCSFRLVSKYGCSDLFGSSTVRWHDLKRRLQGLADCGEVNNILSENRRQETNALIDCGEAPSYSGHFSGNWYDRDNNEDKCPRRRQRLGDQRRGRNKQESKFHVFSVL